MQACLLILSVAAFMLPPQSWRLVTEIAWLAQPKVYFCKKKCADPFEYKKEAHFFFPLA